MDQSDAEMIVIYTTFPAEKDARKVGGELVEQKLAACVNIFPGMVSIYRWQDAIESGSETVMLVKTRKELESQVLEALAAKHPYAVPALIVFEPRRVAASYLEWLCNQTALQR
ncbi:MAG: divalent-cation tolerance protein CutA [Rhodomicrobium sp.]|jgi:periplasmic divalent cation tolerance protein